MGINKMKIVILGSSAAFSRKNEGCSSYLLLLGGKNYLIDTGPGCVSFFQNYISVKDISGIFLSHLHADHVSDIYTLRYAVYAAQRDGYMKPPLPLYMADSPKRTFHFIKDAVKKEMNITEISEDVRLNLDGLKVTFKKTDHPVTTYAMRFDYRGKSIVYTSDTAFFDGIVTFCQGANLLISEATIQNGDNSLAPLGHMTAETAGMLAQRACVKKLVLTHLWPEYDKKISIDEAKITFKGTVLTAERGQEYIV